jgi:hypothetical protein
MYICRYEEKQKRKIENRKATVGEARTEDEKGGEREQVTTNQSRVPYPFLYLPFLVSLPSYTTPTPIPNLKAPAPAPKK